VIGSLWYAALLLLLLLFAMACATVFEAQHGTEPALEFFYKSWWFKLLLTLYGINVLAAVILRYPFSRRRLGFALTHVSILVILVGAWITHVKGVDGQVGIIEGQSVRNYNMPADVLTIVDHTNKKRASVDFTPAVGGMVADENPESPDFGLGDVRVHIEHYVPDSATTHEVINDSSQPQLALEVSFSTAGDQASASAWVFAGQSVQTGLIEIALREVSDQQELSRLLKIVPETQPARKGTIKVDFKDQTHEIPLEVSLNKAVPIADTGYSIRVLRYLPHAVVGHQGRLVNASDLPNNPTIEYDLTGPDGLKINRKPLPAFALFPDLFSKIHGLKLPDGLKITFVATPSNLPKTPIEVLAGPGDQLHVRFRNRTEINSYPLTIGTPIETPWSGFKFVVLQKYDHARIKHSVTPVHPIRKERIPAVLLKLTSADESREMWVQKYNPKTVSMKETTYELSYTNKVVDFGFDLKLERFRIGYYPGGERPRSFESQVTFTDPLTGREQSRVISMNHPTTYGGYTFYQSSYRQNEEQSISYLSVSWDPGQQIVFIGYITMMVGLFGVLITRMMDHRKKIRSAAQQA